MTSAISCQYTLSDFTYELPNSLIATYPLNHRTESRLLCLDKATGHIVHKRFSTILDLISPGDLLVLNNTQVIPARLFAKKLTGGKIEILIERILDKNHILAYLKPSRSLRIGTELLLENGIRLKIFNQYGHLFQIVFLDEVNSIFDLLNTIGHIPLPPYIARPDEALDWKRYQTVFASSPGAIAAPTAGLHFDQILLEQLQTKGVHLAFLTLHIGSGTFRSVRTECIEDHRMHAEQAVVSSAVCMKVKETKERGKRVIAVGTSTVRSLETAAMAGTLQPFAGDTRLFIYPGFRFRCVDAIITNFHLPQSTLLMLVCAFAGYENILAAYQQALAYQYRFFSYGDALYIY